jgi:hypothetical protein
MQLLRNKLDFLHGSQLDTRGCAGKLYLYLTPQKSLARAQQQSMQEWHTHCERVEIPMSMRMPTAKKTISEKHCHHQPVALTLQFQFQTL